MSLVSRHLEANGMPTVIIGSARDIVEECGVARFVYTDFPLGNPCGKPWDATMQRAILGIALEVLETARFPRTTVQTPFSWDSEDWRDSYSRVCPENLAALRAAGDQRRAAQAAARRVQQAGGSD
ncbi:MAG: hypothetical protein ACKVQQ_04765 [Burkholderiales bacterium]